MTPVKISSSGRSTPLRMRKGRRMLSMPPTTIVHTRSTVPHTGSPFQYSQMTAGAMTRKGGSWARARMKMNAASNPGNGTPVTTKPIPPRSAWTSRGKTDAQGNAPDRLGGQDHRFLRLLSGKPEGEPPHGASGRLTVRIQDGGNDDGQHKLNEHHPEASGLFREPFHDLPGVGRQAREPPFRAGRGGFPPHLVQLRAHHGQLPDPVRRRRQGESLQPLHPLHDLIRILHNRSDGQRKRDNKDQQQGQGHQRHGERTFTPQPSLETTA